jgi:hypothetical protein
MHHSSCGLVRWQILEQGLERPIEAGETVLEISDIAVEQVRGQDERELIVRRIALGSGTSVILAQTPEMERARVRGFGLSASRTGAQTFGWDWFHVEADGRAKKIQEEGVLEVELEETRRGWQIGRTVFLTDVSLRIFGDGLMGLAGVMSNRPRWRVQIERGSSVRWLE